MPIVDDQPGAPLAGVIGRTYESSPAWPAPVRAAERARNVLFIVLDETGFGQFGRYGRRFATPNSGRHVQRRRPDVWSKSRLPRTPRLCGAASRSPGPCMVSPWT